MSDTPSHFERMQERYRTCNLSWDQPLPPPEIVELAERLPAGRALDLGCGAGRASIYLAARGWQVDGVDFVPEAIAMAAERARAAGVGERVHCQCAPLTQLDFLHTPYDLIVDVGCMHALVDGDLQAYGAEVARLTRSGGLYVLFAHLRADADDTAPASIPEAAITNLFGDGFSFERVVYGTTEVGELRWRSAWLYLRRRTPGNGDPQS